MEQNVKRRFVFHFPFLSRRQANKNVFYMLIRWKTPSFFGILFLVLLLTKGPP